MVDSPAPDNIGNVMVALMSRSMVNDHFTGYIAEPISIGAETHSGSVYHIVLIPGEPQEYRFEGNVYWIRPAEATINGGENTGTFAGFNLQFGSFIHLNRADDGKFVFVRRSSSLKKIYLLEK